MTIRKMLYTKSYKIMWSSQVSETDTRGKLIEPKLRDIRTIIVNEQSMLHLFYFGLEAI